MTPKKLPSGKWRAQGYYKDPVTGQVSRPSFTANTKAEAARMVAEYQAGRRLTQSQNLTVKECIDRYITSKESTLSVSTIRGYRRMQRNNYSEIENIRISVLTSDVVQEFISHSCKRLSPKSVRNIYALLVSSISMFSDQVFRVTLPQKREQIYDIPTDSDVAELLSRAHDSLRLAIALAAIGTLRAGEVCALRYRDVDHEHGGILVHADMVQNDKGEWLIKDIPKTSASVRFITLPAEVMDMIGDGAPDDLVYGHTPAAINRSFDRLRDKLGLKCRFHDLRHFACSRMHALGIPDQYIQERGGWASAEVMRAVYRNTLSDLSSHFSQVANDHFSTLFRE